MKRAQLLAETRYVQHVRRKNAEKRGIGREEWRWHHAPEHPNQLQGDWSMDMGAGATVGAEAIQPNFRLTRLRQTAPLHLSRISWCTTRD